jgi:hypothetical protein
MPADDEPFAFSDAIREIDEEAPYILLRAFQLWNAPLALLCVDSTSGQESLYTGRVKTTNYTVLEIETFDGENVSLNLTNSEFHPLQQKDAPRRLRAVTSEACKEGFRFDAGKFECFLLVQPGWKPGGPLPT